MLYVECVGSQSDFLALTCEKREKTSEKDAMEEKVS